MIAVRCRRFIGLVPDRATANTVLAYDKRFRVGRTGTNGRSIVPAVLFLPSPPLTNGWYKVKTRRLNGRLHHIEIYPPSVRDGTRKYVIVRLRDAA